MNDEGPLSHAGQGAFRFAAGQGFRSPPSLPPISLENTAYDLTLQASHMSERMVSPMAGVWSPEDIGAHGASYLSPSHALSLALAIFESVSILSSQWETFWRLVSISLAMSRRLTFRSVMASRTRSSSSLSFILILRFSFGFTNYWNPSRCEV